MKANLILRRVSMALNAVSAVLSALTIFLIVCEQRRKDE